jgi:hypothetical protein
MTLVSHCVDVDTETSVKIPGQECPDSGVLRGDLHEDVTQLSLMTRTTGQPVHVTLDVFSFAGFAIEDRQAEYLFLAR